LAQQGNDIQGEGPALALVHELADRGLEFRSLGDFFHHLTEISSLIRLDDFWEEVQFSVSGLIIEILLG
jgi:hypothetical protein